MKKKSKLHKLKFTYVLSQTTEHEFYDRYGQCAFVFYFYLPLRNFSDRRLPISVKCAMCKIWDYQSLQKETISRLTGSQNPLPIDYAWSGAILNISEHDKKFKKFKKYNYLDLISNHDKFLKKRRECRDFKVEPEDAFKTALTSNSEEWLGLKRQVKEYWCKAPPGLEKAINWIPFDDIFFKHNVYWPSLNDSKYWKRDGFY